jgi:hypothetical protein
MIRAGSSGSFSTSHSRLVTHTLGVAAPLFFSQFGVRTPPIGWTPLYPPLPVAYFPRSYLRCQHHGVFLSQFFSDRRSNGSFSFTVFLYPPFDFNSIDLLSQLRIGLKCLNLGIPKLSGLISPSTKFLCVLLLRCPSRCFHFMDVILS